MKRDLGALLRYGLTAGMLMLPTAGFSFLIESHADMSRAAVVRSARVGEHLTDLGLSSLDDKLLLEGTTQSVIEWVRAGARREDDTISEAFARYRNHFFDPRPNAPNNGGFTGFLWPLGLFSGLPAPDWALEPTPIASQIFGFKDARSYFLDALTKPAKAERDSSTALTFRTVGQVIHVVQDMGQPQHTRNDSHLLGSLFERYTNGTRSNLDFLSGSIPEFADSRNFFTNDQGTGLAQYTNRTFVSQDTNFQWDGTTAQPNATYPFPVPLPNPEVASVQSLDVPQAIKSYCGTDTVCNMRFYSSQNDRGEVQPRAATLSIFANDLDQYNLNPPGVDRSARFSLNTLNFQSVLPNIIPRAVGYSAGMINYFFRGKIDYVPDPAPGGQFLVKNLGTEPMNGTFQVYYDDQSGTRRPVDGTLWDTKVILADTGGVLGPGEGMPVPRIVAPVLFPPKTPDEYVLVFSGTMGEETPDNNGSVGAVVGKLIQGTPYHGELYVAGLDAQSRIVTFKVDPSGLRVLNGFDANGQFHNTPYFWSSSAAQRDIDPLFPVVNYFQGQNFFLGNVLTKVLRMKQPVFQTGVLGGMSHQMAAVSFQFSVNNFLSFVRDPTTGRLTFRDNSIRWTAHSQDPTIGDFEFRPESNGTFSYSRIFTPGPNQSPVTTGGSFTLPASSDESGLVFAAFQRGEVVVSPDGLTISGIQGSSQPDASTSFFDTYELRLTLGAQPSVSLVQTEHLLATPLNVAGPNNVTESTSNESGPPNDSTTTVHSLTINDFERIDNQRKNFDDYIAGNPVVWRIQGHSIQTGEDQYDATSHNAFSAICPGPGTILRDLQSTRRNVGKSITTYTIQELDQPISWVITDIPKYIYVTPVVLENYTRTYSSHELYTVDCNGNTIGTPVVQVQDNVVFDPDAFDPSPITTGTSLLRPLNGKVEGSILYDTVTHMFSLRGTILGQTTSEFIADSSPLGEVFAGKTDKSAIVYNPAPTSRMPATIDIPANIVRLIAAVWL